MTHWYLKNNNDTLPALFETREQAEQHRSNMGSVFENLYSVMYAHDDPKVVRMMTEGLVKNDLIDILYPVISIDEYVPSDPNTDNIVIAFYIKGVPEAVIPYKNFIERCNGVLVVDHGNSDTIRETSVIYIEMDRGRIAMDDINDIVSLSALIAGLKPEDFSMRFPHTDKKFPYDIKLMKQYFTSRKVKDNQEAQKEAEAKAERETEEKLKRIEQSKQPEPEEEPEQEQSDQERPEDQQENNDEEQGHDLDDSNNSSDSRSDEAIINHMASLI